MGMREEIAHFFLASGRREISRLSTSAKSSRQFLRPRRFRRAPRSEPRGCPLPSHKFHPQIQRRHADGTLSGERRCVISGAGSTDGSSNPGCRTEGSEIRGWSEILCPKESFRAHKFLRLLRNFQSSACCRCAAQNRRGRLRLPSAHAFPVPEKNRLSQPRACGDHHSRAAAAQERPA